MPERNEEQKVKDIISDARNKTAAVDHADHDAPHPQPVPPGGVFMGPSHHQGVIDEAAREHQKEEIRQEALNKSADAIKNTPTAEQVKTYRIADEFAYPETARQSDPKLKQGQKKDLDQAQRSAMHQMGYTDLKARQGKEKNISESQDYAMRRLGDEKEKNKSTEPKKENEPFKGASMSKSFSASLGYAKLNKPIDKAPDDRATKEPVTMSGKFSSTLGYNKMNTESKSAALTSKMKSNGKDMTKD